MDPIIDKIRVNDSVWMFANISDTGVKIDPKPNPNDNPYITVSFFPCNLQVFEM